VNFTARRAVRRVLLSAPKITYDRSMRPSFSLMVGSSIFIEVNVAGQPRPAVSWFHNDVKVEDESSRVSTETAEGWSSLKVKASTAEDAGTYRVTAENAAGFDSADFRVLVKGSFSVKEVEGTRRNHRGVYPGLHWFTAK